MTCREIQPILARLAGCEGAPRVALDAARHLAGCPACAETLLRMRQVSTMLDHLPKMEVPRTFAERVLKSLPKRAGQVGGTLVLALFALAGVAASVGGSGGSLWRTLGSPIESATLTLAALVAASQALLDLIVAAFAMVELSVPMMPGGIVRMSLPMAALTIFAALTLAASAAAIGGGVLSLQLERRSGHPPLA